VPLDDEVVASIFGEIGKDPKEPERGQTESIDQKQAKELEARLQIHATGPMGKVQGMNYAVSRCHFEGQV
jgi:hypothetical protein